MRFRGWMITAAVCAVLGVVPADASAQSGWLTYDQNGARSAQDVDTTNPWSPSLDWTSPDLDGIVYGQPLVDGSNVYVATENDTVYDLNLYTGAVVWSNHFGTAVPSTYEPCGIIMPELGDTSTPVIDTSNNEIFLVAENWDGTDASSIGFDMYGFNLSSGSETIGPVNVTPSGMTSGTTTPADYLQRPGLALENGNLYLGFGSQGSACEHYNGFFEEVPESGVGPFTTFTVDPAPLWGGSIWAGGNAPSIDPNGDIWITTADAMPGETNTTGAFGYSESIIQFDPNLNMLGFWVPQNWETLDSDDTELGSSMPLQLPDGLWFQNSKTGMGYLISQSSLSPEGTNPSSVAGPLWSGQVCPTPDGNWAGEMYYNGVIYLTCQQGGATHPGLFAYTLDTSTPSLTPVANWYSNLGSITPPIEAGGLIWSSQWSKGVVYAVSPTTGHVEFSATLGRMPHFTGISAGGGLVFVPHTDPSNTSDYQVTAYHINNTVVNGGFQTSDFTGWTQSGQFKKILHASSCYGPVYCAQLGRTSATNGPSSISQSFTAPAGGSPSLSFYYKNVCTGTVTNGYATATLVDSTVPRRKTITVLPKTCTNTGTWVNVSQSLYPGDQYTLTLTNWDDNDPTYYSETFVDNVVVQ
jgi:outer membrane protein assembly factor BamB